MLVPIDGSLGRDRETTQEKECKTTNPICTGNQLMHRTREPGNDGFDLGRGMLQEIPKLDLTQHKGQQAFRGGEVVPDSEYKISSDL